MRSLVCGFVGVLLIPFTFLALADLPVVEEYGLCKSEVYPCRERSSVFEATDAAVYVYVRLGLMSEGHTVRWEWISPDGKIYHTAEVKIPEPGFGFYWRTYRLVVSLPLYGTRAAAMPGKWRVHMFIHNTRLLSLEFEVLPSFGASPASQTPLPRPVDDLRSGSWPYTEGMPLVSVLLARSGAGPENWVKVERVLIDTGSEYSLFPKWVAEALGLDLGAGTRARLVDLSGTEITVWIYDIRVSFLTPQGKSFQPIMMRAAFSDMEVKPVIGRLGFLGVVQAFFEKTGFRLELSG